MKRLYQWFSKRASFFRSDTAGQETRRTRRTEVTVRQEGITLLMDGAAVGFGICPFCGNKLNPQQPEEAKLRLLKDPPKRDYD